MPDITMCKGNECPLKLKCYRYIAIPSQMQSYFMESPYKNEICEFFIEDDISKEKENGQD